MKRATDGYRAARERIQVFAECNHCTHVLEGLPSKPPTEGTYREGYALAMYSALRLAHQRRHRRFAEWAEEAHRVACVLLAFERGELTQDETMAQLRQEVEA